MQRTDWITLPSMKDATAAMTASTIFAILCWFGRWLWVLRKSFHREAAGSWHFSINWWACLVGTDLCLTAEGSGQQFFFLSLLSSLSPQVDGRGSANERRNAMNNESSEAEKRKNKTELPTKWFFVSKICFYYRII